MIQFVLHLEPVAKGRPRFNFLTRSAYTPGKTRAYEKDLRLFSKRYAPKEVLRGPLRVDLCFFLLRPKSVKTIYPIKRPDADNFAKSVIDSMNEIFYRDDSQIVDLNIKKRYCGVERPSISVQIEELQEIQWQPIDTHVQSAEETYPPSVADTDAMFVGRWFNALLINVKQSLSVMEEKLIVQNTLKRRRLFD